jgi:hypothetical protein
LPGCVLSVSVVARQKLLEELCFQYCATGVLV